MAYIGIGYTGEDAEFLARFVEQNNSWLNYERQPVFYGKQFLVLYDSNIAREFVKKCTDAASAEAITLFYMEKTE